MAGASTGLLSRIDAETTERVRDWLEQVLRHQRVRLVNRLGSEVPLRLEALEAAGAGATGRADRGIRLAGLARLDPSGLPLLVGVDGLLLSRLVGVLLGGTDAHGDGAHRALTPTDKRVGARIVEDLVRGLELALPAACAQRLVPGEVGDGRHVGLGLPDSSAVFRATISVGDEDDTFGRYVLTFPVALVGTLWPGRTHSPAADSNLSRVLPMTVEAVAELARVKLPLSRVHQLQVGDTLDLGRLTEVVLRVRGEPTLRGEPGTIDGVRCMRVRARTNLGRG